MPTLLARVTDDLGQVVQQSVVVTVQPAAPTQLVLIVADATATASASGPGLTISTVNDYADLYDVIVLHGTFGGDVVSALKARRPGLIALQGFLPVATLPFQAPGILYPTSYYMRDLATGSYVRKFTWYLLDFRQPVVRQATLDRMFAITSPGVDGFWTDVSWAAYIASPFQKWFREPESSGIPADLGDLDGGWLPGMSWSTTPNFTDGTFPAAILAWHQLLRDARPNDIRIYNGFESQSVYDTVPPYWRDRQAESLAMTSGANKESVFAVNSTLAVSESQWVYYVNQFLSAMAQGKYVHITGFYSTNAALKLFCFASYLLIADGRLAWFESSAAFDATLFRGNYGSPDLSVNGGNYQALPASPSGTIYKRTLTGALVYVNPGSVTRTADGQTLGPSTGRIVTL